MQLDLDAKNLLQRYLMALFYFHTSSGGEKPWRSCGPPGDGDSSTGEFLRFERRPDDSIGFVPVPDSTRWLSGEFECLWEGVRCVDGEDVLGLELCEFPMVATESVFCELLV